MSKKYILRGDKVIKKTWMPKKKEYKETHYKESILYLLMETVTLENVTLRDLCNIIEDDVAILSIIYPNCWIMENVNEVLKTKKGSVAQSFDKIGLTWSLESDVYSTGRTTFGHEFPSLHGYTTSVSGDNSQYHRQEANGLYSWACDFTPAVAMADTEILLDPHAVLYYQKNKKTIKPDHIQLDDMSYTLGHVIYGVFWEISFLGGPEEAKKRSDEMFKLAAKVKADLALGKLKTYKSYDDFLKEIEEGSE